MRVCGFLSFFSWFCFFSRWAFAFFSNGTFGGILHSSLLEIFTWRELSCLLVQVLVVDLFTAGSPNQMSGVYGRRLSSFSSIFMPLGCREETAKSGCTIRTSLGHQRPRTYSWQSRNPLGAPTLFLIQAA